MGEIGTITGFAGALVEPGDEGYDETRAIFNSMIDKRPALIARCGDTADVQAAIAHGVDNDLEIAIRSGGHSVAGAGLSDGGLVIDMRAVNTVEVDPDARRAVVGGGATWADVDRATAPHGLATTGGRVSTTGVAGLTLGGGSGWLERKFGLACDSLEEVELATADGRIVRASESENPELFWALHGGGGNFGVATKLTFGLHELPAITLMLLLWPADRGREVAAAYRDFAETAPDELGGGVIYLTGPPEEFVPEHLVGKLACAVLVTYAGTEAEARSIAAPLLDLEPEGQMIAELPYNELQSAIDDPPGFRNYWSAEYLSELPDAALDSFCASATEMVVPSPSQHILFPWGGAVARNGGGWPIADRDVPWVYHPFGLWEDAADDERAIAYARNACAGMREWATGGVYLNFIADEGDDRVIAGYGGAENYSRLAAVKAEYDAGNVFRLNHNIAPA